LPVHLATVDVAGDVLGFTDRDTLIDNTCGPRPPPLPFDRDNRTEPAPATIRERVWAGASHGSVGEPLVALPQDCARWR